MEEVNLSNSLAVFDDSSIYHVLDDIPKNEVFDFSLEQVNYVDSAGIENFLSNFTNNNFEVGLEVLEDIFNFCSQESIDPFWESDKCQNIHILTLNLHLLIS